MPQVWVGGIEVTGRPDVARVVNASLGAILGSLRPDRPFGISPNGLGFGGDSQTGYNAHAFWDMVRFRGTWCGYAVGVGGVSLHMVLLL